MHERVSLSNVLVLNVDDNDAARYMKTRLLNRAGFAVREAASGLEALHIAETDRPQVVCLDVKLPDVSGHEVCRHLKNKPATASIMVLQVSATYVLEEQRARGLDEGADAYMPEPMEPREFIATVRSLLRIWQASEAMRASEARLRFALENAGMVAWEWDLVSGACRWTGHANRVLGRDDFPATAEALFEAIHADDRETVRTMCRSAMEQRSSYTVDFRVRSAGDRTQWVHQYGRAVVDATGTPVSLSGIMQDITESKLLAQERDRLVQSLQEERRRLEHLHAALERKVADLESFEEVVVGRELKMIELEKENAQLRDELERMKRNQK